MKRTLSLALVATSPTVLPAQHDYLTTDRFVPHMSGLLADCGQRVDLFPYEKQAVEMSARITYGESKDLRGDAG